ncbi:short-chain dehydrogenase [Brevibacillus sp. DP1.3A]|uniref:short-chain dehydrogenase n=1 Tax=Brevibacillus sp. DP1.3A TaxID=2738867 RepID=UPI00156B25A7|nr:short-chain dehydrogenase [Brevibacillus sp. DP1.3A]UED73282.1 short-chain dehydrogenase [Brevibacillus sp. DP1.3A]
MAKEALVIGASGMLIEVSRWLARQGYQVTVLGRDPVKLRSVRDGSTHPESFHMLPQDYHQTESLREAMAELVEKRGPMDVVVAWIHSTAPHALYVIVEELSCPEKHWQLLHVCGSGAWRNPPIEPTSEVCIYRRVVLGFTCTGEHSRWLTNDEIAVGVIDALQATERQIIVGQVEPWEKRPTY